MQETWKAIPGCEAFYEASDLGRVRSLDRLITTSTGKARLSRGRVLIPQLTGRRYPAVSISLNGAVKSISIHRMVARTFLPNPKLFPEINHIDGNRENNATSNLEWCTRAQNNDHAIDTGLKPPVKGQDHGRAVLTEVNVLEIRARHSKGESMKHLACIFSVSTQSIHGIVRRKYWKHI
ncbi:NUMOD4 domain-containing protein [Massilia antarctica]|uniref:NUMOD4 domain-containing protein n=1 Tax=Massilia antarctica TaxID=2765360 RepID=UPI00227015F9|nr:NUMOD4 domain-containing protein [Massilia sp. H27-R4]MCY0910840.1 NUMOD4 domain-containing protein [Massilia sp. H27-R4]